MAPRNTTETAPPRVTTAIPDSIHKEEGETSAPVTIVWFNVFWMIVLHLAGIYGLYLLPWAGWKIWAWTAVLYVCSGIGITAGAHRLWSHRSYKARLPTRILLAAFNTMASQNDVIEWARDHRVHHKYSETHGDPHNAKRGFFFAHVGWLLTRKHPELKRKGKSLYYSDLYSDPVLVFQRDYFPFLTILMCYVFPAFVPWYFWNTSFSTAFFCCSILRYVLLLNATWCVNSAAHMWGNKPYDKNINPCENRMVSFWAGGEGYHNYHHTFPQDYSTSELGWTKALNISTMFIDFMAVIGQVYDRKKMSHEAVFRRKQRTGDDSHSSGSSSRKHYLSDILDT